MTVGVGSEHRGACNAEKYQVFISSTFKDLVEERQDTLKSVLDMGHIPSGMEIFPAADVEQFEYIKKIIDECDYYVLIVAARYGSLDAAGISYTEKEYHYAVSQKKTVLAFIHNDVGNIAEQDRRRRRVAEEARGFQTGSSNEPTRSTLEFKRGTASQVIVSLHKAITEYPAVGWMKASAAASEDLLAQINQLLLENDELRSRAIAPFDCPETLAEPESTFRIQYRYEEWNGAAWKESQGTLSVDWKTLLVLLAPQFSTPRKVIVASLLSTALKEKKFIPAPRRDIKYSLDRPGNDTSAASSVWVHCTRDRHPRERRSFPAHAVGTTAVSRMGDYQGNSTRRPLIAQ